MKLHRIFVASAIMLFSSSASSLGIRIDGFNEHYAFLYSEKNMSVSLINYEDLSINTGDTNLSTFNASNEFTNAYLENFRNCVAPRDKTPPTPLLINNVREDSYFYRRIGQTDIALISTNNSKQAFLFNLRTNSIISPPCSLFVQAFTANYDQSLVTLVAKDVKKITTYGHWSRWVAKYANSSRIYVFNFSNSPTPKPIIIPTNENVTDVRMSSNGTILILTEKRDYLALINPLNWARSIAGHPPQHSTFGITIFDRHGNVSKTITLAKRVPYASASFINAKQ